MPRCLYLNSAGQQRRVWLGDRCADAIARMVDATRPQEPGSARAAEILGGPSWAMPSGLLAAHALAVSAVHVATSLISIGPDISAESRDLDLICSLAAELRPLAAELDAASLSTFDAVGIVHALPDGHGTCTSTHAAVAVVLADVRKRLEPILTTLGLLSDTESAWVLADRAREQGSDPLASAWDQIVEHYHASLVKRWAGWAAVERTLVAEVAAAAKAGLITAEGDRPLDQARFDAAIDQILGTQDETKRQDLFGRWRSLAALLRHLRISGMHLPSLGTERQLIDGLGRLTSEVLAQTQDAKAEAPALLEFLDVLRELTTLMVREKVIRDRGGVPDLDADFRASLTHIVSEVLPRVLRAATMQVDAIALRSAAPARSPSGLTAPPPDAPPTAAPPKEHLTFDPVERAIVLLLRDGKNPRSTRAYADEVGVSHTTLGRNEKWKRAYEAAEAGQLGDLPEGTKDKDGKVEAWEDEVCENCRQEPIERNVTVRGEAVRVCEECARKLAPRTNPRTT